MADKNNNQRKETIKLGASTLISNQACVDMARTRPWYGAVIGAVLAVVIAVIPLMSSQFKAQGADLLDKPKYSLDEGLIHFQEDLNSKNTSMLIDSTTDEMTVTNWVAMTGVDNDSWNCKIDNKNVLEVFWTEKEGEELTSYASEKTASIDHSYILFFKKGFVISKHQPGSTSGTTIKGQYDLLTKNYDLKDAGKKTFDGVDFDVNEENKTTNNYNTYYQNSLQNWAEFLTITYKTYKNSNAWSWTGIMVGVYAVFVIFMGLLIFLMTRGKTNPYRIYTFWETQKMAYWASFAPAVIGMVLGFILSNMAMMGFIFVYGLRIMWLAMKTVKPQ